MDKGKNKVNVAALVPATEAQKSLIKALLEETQCNEIPPSYTNGTMNKEEASEFVHYLKEYKVRDQQLRAQNKLPANFDKIAFGLCYKLVYNNWSELGSYAAVNNKTFTDCVVEEYFKFKDTQQHCREQVAGGGQP